MVLGVREELLYIKVSKDNTLEKKNCIIALEEATTSNSLIGYWIALNFHQEFSFL